MSKTKGSYKPCPHGSRKTDCAECRKVWATRYYEKAKSKRIRFKEYQCQQCGNRFESQQNNPRYCSLKCSGIAQSNAASQYSHLIRPSQIARLRVCKQCGCIFKHKDSDGIGTFCSKKCWGAARTAMKIAFKRSKPLRSNVWFGECLWCGEQFTNKRKVMYCSPMCTKEAAAAKALGNNRLKKDTSERVCAECGMLFVSEYGNKKRSYCSNDCMQKRLNRIGHKTRRARKRGVNCESVDPYTVFQRDNYRCKLCGKKTLKDKRGTTHSQAPELDHIIPLSLGGEHTYRNTQCSCRLCNQKKGGRWIGQTRLC